MIQTTVTNVNEISERLKEIVFAPIVVKVGIIILGSILIWLIIKAFQKNLLSNIKDNDNSYRARKFGNFIGYFLTCTTPLKKNQLLN